VRHPGKDTRSLPGSGQQADSLTVRTLVEQQLDVTGIRQVQHQLGSQCMSDDKEVGIRVECI